MLFSKKLFTKTGSIGKRNYSGRKVDITKYERISEFILKVPITIAYGDGIGPEITEATVKILESAGAQLDFQTIDIGERLYLGGHKSGIAPDAWESIRKTRVFLKAPITTPTGGGYKSLNVTIRKTLGLYANVRPCRSYFPFISTKHPILDVVVVRENEEDLYAGIEHQQTDQVFRFQSFHFA